MVIKARVRPEGFPEGARLEEGKWYLTRSGNVIQVLTLRKYEYTVTDDSVWGYAECSDKASRLVAGKWIGSDTWADEGSSRCFVSECRVDGTPLNQYKQEQLDLFE